MISDTTYDSRGLAAKTSVFYNSASAPTSTLATFADKDVPTQDLYTYDNLERQTVDGFWSGNGATSALKWQTTTVYDGDRTGIIPPAGGTVTQKVFDVDGNTTELRQYQSSTGFTGSYLTTHYTYDRSNRLTKLTDSAGIQWTWTFDLRGHNLTAGDPDSGTTTNTYDDAGNLLTTKDGRAVTLAYVYDPLGRRTDRYLTTTTGTLLDHWDYDALAKGRLDDSIDYRGSDQYKVIVAGYDDAYRPLGQTVRIPASAGTALAGRLDYHDRVQRRRLDSLHRLPGGRRPRRRDGQLHLRRQRLQPHRSRPGYLRLCHQLSAVGRRLPAHSRQR